MATVHELPAIIRESVKPMENIDGIKIIQMNGLPGSAGLGQGGSEETSSQAPKNLAEQVVNSALQYRAQAPLLDSLMSEVGLSGNGLEGLTKNLQLKDHDYELTQHPMKNNENPKKGNNTRLPKSW